MDKFENYIKQKFEDFRPEPPKSLWKAIHKQIIPWYKTIAFKITAIITTFALVTGATLLLTTHKNTASYTATPIQENPYSLQDINFRQPANNTQFHQTHSKKITTQIPPQTSRLKSKQKLPDTNKITTPVQNTLNKPALTYTQPTASSKVNFKISIFPHTGCEPLTVTFSVQPPQNMNITWFIDRQIVSDKDVFQYTLHKGTHFVQLALFDHQQTILVYDTITVLPRPAAEFEADRCKAGDTLSLHNLSINAKSYVWSFGDGHKDTCHNPYHVYSSQGLYNVTLIARNDYCSDTVSHLIAVEPQDKDILFPNAFIPDINGPSGGYYNPNKPATDIFHPVTRKPVKTYNLKIFDRRGKLIFESNDINRGWDGYYRNKLVPVGVYIFVAQGRFEDGQPFTVKGDITVIYKMIYKR